MRDFQLDHNHPGTSATANAGTRGIAPSSIMNPYF